jgi:hypothetical protein
MNTLSKVSVSRALTSGPAILALLLSCLPAHAQSWEITPLVGGMFGGSVNLEQLGVPNFKAHVQERWSYGIAGGYRFDSDDCKRCDTVQFRWLRQDTHLLIQQDPLVVTPLTATPFHPHVTFDHFLVDFTHEWRLKEGGAKSMLRPFLTATLGAARMGAPAASAAKFVFGFSTGVNVLPKPHFGIHFAVEWLPIVMEGELQRVVCAGGCIVMLDGGLINQFNISVGPIFRF